MAIIAMESFDLGYLNPVWRSTILLGPGRTGIGCVRPGLFTSSFFSFPKQSSEIYVGFAFDPSSGPSNINTINLYGDNGGTTHFTLVWDSVAQVVTVTSGSNTLGTYSSQNIKGQVWRYIEIHAKLSDTAGIAQVWLDEQLIIDFAGDTKNGGTGTVYDTINLGYYNGNYPAPLFDDFYLLDTTGTINNSRLGDIDVIALHPNGNGSLSQLTGSDGDQIDNYALVDESGTPSNTNYVSGATAGLTDLYALQDTPANVQQVQAVRVSYDAQKGAAGYAAMQPLIKANGATSTGAVLPLSTTESQYQSTIMETDPTGANWTKTTLDSAEIGVETA